ncbi:MAG: S8 family serine peptidase [Bryobacteraceae bacterium]|nr:S8 family serine peptidase [Bryobacteraceae bacterium]
MTLRIFFALIAAMAASWAAEPVRYIVELTETPAIVSPPDVRQARRQAIGRQHASVERAIRSAARDAKIVARLELGVNALIVEAAEGSLPLLASLPGVKKVQPSRDLKLHLDRALDIHHVRQAWEAAGNRGKGVRVGILDTGIQADHPGFKAPDWMQAPEGFPQASNSSNDGANQAFTSNKIIAARTYDAGTVADTYGHGTATAMIAAGVEHESPNGVISGLAPDAFLGVYKVSRFGSNAIPTDFVVQALETAISDQMDVVNISLGSLAFFEFPEDILAETANRMAEAGMIVVNSAGNDGPEIMSMDGGASAPLVLGVGSTLNNRVSLSPAVVLPDGEILGALASTNASIESPNVEGVLLDVTQFDSTSLLCDLNVIPEGAFEGKIPLIKRGDCNFTVKLRNAYLRGARTAVVYNRGEDPTPNALVSMSVGDDPTIAAVFIGYDDGMKLREAVAAAIGSGIGAADGGEDGEGEVEVVPPGYSVNVRFVTSPDPNRISTFSSLGPSIDYAIKPDLVATGSSVYTAGQTINAGGGLYTADGYVTTSGTSFSAPMVAGAAAVVKATRPGLYGDDYRSLIVNSAKSLPDGNGGVQDVMKAGAGALNVDAALRNTLTARPTSLSFGVQDSTLDVWKQVIVKNISKESRSYTVEIQSANEVQPLLTATALTLSPDEIAGPVLVWNGLYEPGNYQGFVVFRETETGVETRVPYWMAVKTNTVSRIGFIEFSSTSYYVRLHDVSGAAISDVVPTATVVTGGALISDGTQYVSTATLQQSTLYPNLWWMPVRQGVSSSTIEISAGDVKRTVTVSP